MGSHFGDMFFVSFRGVSSIWTPACSVVLVVDGFLSGFIRGIGDGDGFLTNVSHLAAAYFVISLWLILLNDDVS